PGNSCASFPADVSGAVSPNPLLVWGKEFSRRDIALAPGRHNARAGAAQGQVLLIRLLNECIKNGIVEYSPPAAEILGRDTYPLGLAVDPFAGHRGRRVFVIGAHLGAVVDVFLNARATPGNREDHAFQPA